MNRRAFLGISVSGSALLAGCSQIEQLANDVSDAASGKNALGDTVSYGEVDVTVTDAMLSEQFTFNDDDVTSPDNGIYALFEVEAHNTDVTEREIPHVSEKHYETLEKEENTIYIGDINDIRVYGDNEGGYFPDVRWRGEFQMDEQEDGTIVMGSDIEFSVNGVELNPYPVGTTRPRIDADATLAGWVVGVIDRDATPQLKIQYDENSAMWTAKDADLSPPESNESNESNGTTISA